VSTLLFGSLTFGLRKGNLDKEVKSNFDVNSENFKSPQKTEANKTKKRLCKWCWGQHTVRRGQWRSADENKMLSNHRGLSSGAVQSLLECQFVSKSPCPNLQLYDRSHSSAMTVGSKVAVPFDVVRDSVTFERYAEKLAENCYLQMCIQNQGSKIVFLNFAFKNQNTYKKTLKTLIIYYRCIKIIIVGLT